MYCFIYLYFDFVFLWRQRIEISNLFIMQYAVIHLTTLFELQLVCIFPAPSRLQHFHTKCWLKCVKFSLKNKATFDPKLRLTLSIFFNSLFFSNASLSCFLFTNQTIVFFGLDLPSLWHPSISLFFILMLSNSKILTNLSSTI